MKDLVDNASEVELTAVSNYIDARYWKALDKHERPWEAYFGNENDSEVVKKWNYLAR